MIKMKYIKGVSKYVKEENLVQTYNTEIEFDSNDIEAYIKDKNKIVDRFAFNISLKRNPINGKYTITVTSNPIDGSIFISEFYMNDHMPCLYPAHLYKDNIYHIAGPIVNYMTEKSEIEIVTSLRKKIILKSIYLDKKGLDIFGI